MSVKFRIDFKTAQRLPTKLFSEDGFALPGRSSDTVLLIHGLTGAPNEMKRLGFLLNQHGYAVRCPRLAHHGEPIGILKDTKWQECYQSVRAAFFQLEKEKPNGQIFVSGLSMGALLALLLAEEFPDRIAGVSCLSPTLFYDGWNTPWSRHLLPLAYATPLKHFFYFKEESPYGIKNEAIRERIHRYYEKAGLDDIDQVAQYGYPYFPVSLLTELHFLVGHLSKRLGRIKTPVQLIQAKEDDMTSVKNSQFIYDRIQSDIKEMVLLYDSYHIITADQERDLVAEKVGFFFDRLRNGTKFIQPGASAEVA